MKQKSVEPKGGTHYYPRELMPGIYCAACLAVVLHENKEAKRIYDDIVECYKSRGLTDLFDKMLKDIPQGEELLKRVVKKAGYDYRKPPDTDDLGISVIPGLMKGAVATGSDYGNNFLPWAGKNNIVKMELTLLMMKIDDLVAVGFNRKSDTARGKQKITAWESGYLAETVVCMSMFKFNESRLPDLDRFKVFSTKRKNYSIMAILNNRAGRRLRDKFARHFKTAGFLMKHDEKVENAAWDWYQSRVVYSGPEEYCREWLLLEGDTLYPANVSNDIRVCDDALGYQRVKRNAKPEVKGSPETRVSRLGGLINKVKSGWVNKNIK